MDLEAERVEVYRLEDGRFPGPVIVGRGERLETPLLPGYALDVDDVLGPPSE